MTLTGSRRTFMKPAGLLRAARQPPVLTRETTLAARHSPGEWVTLGGTPVKLLEFDEAFDSILDRAVNGGQLPLGVASANLDHVKHFGQASRWADVLEKQETIEWLPLLDGAPLVAQAERITHRRWPRLAGSDLIGPVLEAAEATGLRVGFLGGTADTHAVIKDRFATAYPDLTVAGWWAPERNSLADPQASQALAAEIFASGSDILVVCLGKPRQELWISEFGILTGARVMLAFGAAVDFLAGRAHRAPAPVRDFGLEWAWRLALEPRRLATRYLVEGPEAYLKLRRDSGAGRAPAFTPVVPGPRDLHQQNVGPAPAREVGFSPREEKTDVAVLIVTYNSGNDLPLLLASLRPETLEQSIKVIVADNSPAPNTLLELRHRTDVHIFPTGGNLGYAGGINAAMKRAGAADSYLVLNPDTRVEPGSVRALRERMSLSGAGAVVPLLIDHDGSIYPSLRHEPSVSGALGDAIMGSKLPGRPAWLSEMDFDAESYRHPHPVDWATGAALLVRADVVVDVGDWDESFFLYSEETDYMHRIRELGVTVWFEPRARLHHSRGGSGTSPVLDALMATNRIRYVRKYHPVNYARAFRAAVVLSALLRAPMARHRNILAVVGCEKSWDDLPHAFPYAEENQPPKPMPTGSIIIPAHNEAGVIVRTVSPLAALAALEHVQVIVACNGCNDGTEKVLEEIPDISVISISESSKAAALNAADALAKYWPRIYVDADIEIDDSAVRTLFRALDDGGLLAARPASRYVTDEASFFVSAYYRARSRIPGLNNSMWGGGVYGLSQIGHARMGQFPLVTADDYFVDQLFDQTEKQVLPTEPVLVRTPLTVTALVSTLHRVYRGVKEQSGLATTTRVTALQLLSTVRGPLSAFDAFVYAAFAIAGRLSRAKPVRWERDESSRRPARPVRVTCRAGEEKGQDRG